ncbi:MAG: hypothetical protein JNM83_05105 [Myxococcales bacterium]|jgi:hypothetical protein|nr:hypothetical protein [Myxococcales bacterium]
MLQLGQDVQTGVDKDGYGASVLSASDSILEARLTGTTPWWEVSGQDPQTMI